MFESILYYVKERLNDAKSMIFCDKYCFSEVPGGMTMMYGNSIAMKHMWLIHKGWRVKNNEIYLH